MRTGGPGELLGPVEVAEGHVVQAAAALGQGRAAQGGEDAGGHGVDAADANVPLGLARLTADDEGVGHEQARQAPGAAGAQAVQVRGHEAQGGGDDGLVGAGQARALRSDGLGGGVPVLVLVFPCCVLRGGLLAEAFGEEGREDLAGGVGVEVGQGVDDGSLGAVGVGQDDAAVEAGGAGPDDEALAHEVGGEAEAAGGVVVAGGEDHPGALGQAAQRLIEEGDGVVGRDGAVVDVPGDEDGID